MRLSRSSQLVHATYLRVWSNSIKPDGPSLSSQHWWDVYSHKTINPSHTLSLAFSGSPRAPNFSHTQQDITGSTGMLAGLQPLPWIFPSIPKNKGWQNKLFWRGWPVLTILFPKDSSEELGTLSTSLEAVRQVCKYLGTSCNTGEGVSEGALTYN